MVYLSLLLWGKNKSLIATAQIPEVATVLVVVSNI